MVRRHSDQNNWSTFIQNHGSVICHHIDHIHINHSPPQEHISAEVDDTFMFPHHQPTSTPPNGTAETAPQQPPVLYRSTRVRHPPNHFS